MKIATTFSGGFGSVEMSLKYLGIKHEIVFACEWLSPQRKSYIQNYGEPETFYKDIKDLNGTKYRGQIDFLHQSPPCQSYSIAGNRGGLEDERGGLMMEAIRVIREVQPKMFTVENVRGLLSSNGGEDWKAILKDFKALKGYSITWGIMNAKEQGTPQNRERVFIVGFRSNKNTFSFPRKQPLKYKLFDLLENDVNEKYYLSDKAIARFKKSNRSVAPGNRKTEIAPTFIAQYSKIPTDGFYIKEDLIQIGNIDTKGHNSLWGRVYSLNGVAPTQNAKGGGAGAKTGLFLVKSNTKSGYEIAKNGDGISLARPSSTTRRGRVGKEVAQTLDTSSSQGVLLNNKIRRLTPREASRVQGDFEDKFILDGFSDTKLYEFIGNAMDISTTKNLISKMIKHLNNIELNEAIIQDEIIQVKQKTLF